MTDAELERRLARLITRSVSADIATLNGLPQLGCVNTLEGLDGFFSKIVNSIKYSVKAPFKMLKAVASGKMSNVKAVIKSDIKQTKIDLINIAPVAAIVANVIPGVGQIAAVGIAAAGAALKAKEANDKAKAANAAALAEQTRVNAEAQAAYDAQMAAEAVANKTAADEAARIVAETAELKKQTDEIAARTAEQAQKAGASYMTVKGVQEAANQAINTGLIGTGMTQAEIAAQIIRQNMANKGTGMNSPEAQELVYDVANDATLATAGVSGDAVSKALPWLAISGGLLYFALRGRGSASGSRMRRRDWK